MAEVTLENVYKIYPGDVLAVDDFNLNIADEEFIVLVGPSGCGKSTTLRMVAGLEEITKGTIQIGDRVVNEVAPKDRDIAMVFQNYALYPHMSVYKNMAFALKLRKFPKEEIDSRVREAADVLGIGNLLERKPKALSGGQRQRVAVGRAIVRHPAAFLFDEPLSNLDAKLRVSMRAELKRLHHTLRTTTIYVTHDQEEAMTLGDRIVVMKDGIIQQIGSPLQVYTRPVNQFVAGFVGTPPMNFINGKLVGKEGGVWFDEGAFQLRLPEDKAARVTKAVGTEVVLGIRPEAMSLEADGRFKENHNVMPLKANVVEPLGDNMDMYCSTPNHPQIVARVHAVPGIEADQDVKLYIDSTRMHIFEQGELGANISLVEEAQQVLA
jgi:multiple sugar transport system ATP-binding protein